MGTTFANIQIDAKSKSIVMESLQKGENVIQVAQNWITLLQDTVNYKKFKSRSISLSKLIESPLIYTEYFDDDIIDIMVFQAGKKICSYTNREGNKFLKKPKIWQSTFSLNEEEIKALRLLSKSNGHVANDTKILEALLGVILYIDKKMLHLYDGKDLYCKDDTVIKTFIQDEKQKNSIKNQTKAQLLYKSEGQYVGSTVKGDRCVIKTVLPINGKYDLSHIYCFEIGIDKLIPYHDYILPEHIFPKGSTWMHEVWLSPSQLQITSYENEIFCTAENIMEGNLYESELYGDKADFLSTKPDIKDGYTFQVRWKAPNKIIDKISPNGTNLISCIIPDKLRLDVPIIASDHLICFCEDITVHNWEVLIYDFNLKLTYRNKLQSFFNSIWNNYIYSEYHASIFLWDNSSVGIFDLNTCTFKSEKIPTNAIIRFLGLDHKHNLMLREGASTFYIIDANLNILSKHKLKGTLHTCFTQEDKATYFVTSNCNWELSENPKKEQNICIYSLKYPK